MEALARINPNGWGWAGTAVGPYHRFDVGVRDGVKLVEVELVIGADVDIRAPILRLVTVLRCREDYMLLLACDNEVSPRQRREKSHLPVMHFPSCSSS